MNATDERRSERLRLAALVALCLLLFFSGLGRRAIWDTDEGLHSTIAKGMVQTGDWVTPRFNGVPFYDKPALFFWFVAASFSVLGFTEFAARFPAALLGLGTVLVTYGFGRRVLGARAAYLGSVVLATTLEFVILSNVVVHDIALTFFLTVGLLAFQRALADPPRARPFLLTGYVATGLAVLAKGPVGLVLPAAVVVLYVLARREPGALRDLMVVRGGAIVLALSLPWYVAVSLRDPHYLSYFLLEKNLGSVVSQASSHPNPVWYYVPVLLLGFFPWSGFLPQTLGRLLMRRSRIDPPRLFLLVWVGVVFVLFSVATSKLVTYILPLFPPLALLVGDWWDEVFVERSTPRRRAGLVVSELCLIGILAWAVPVFWLQATRHPMYDPAAHRPHLIALTTILVSSVVAGAVALWLRAYRAIFVVNAGLLVVLVLYGLVFLLPVVDPYRSSRDVARELDAELPPGEKLAFYHEIRESALFYTDRGAVQLDTTEDLERYLDRPGARCIVDASWYTSIEGPGQRFRIVERKANKIVIEELRSQEPLTSGSTAPGPGPASSSASSPARDSSATADPG